MADINLLDPSLSPPAAPAAGDRIFLDGSNGPKTTTPTQLVADRLPAKAPTIVVSGSASFDGDTNNGQIVRFQTPSGGAMTLDSDALSEGGGTVLFYQESGSSASFTAGAGVTLLPASGPTSMDGIGSVVTAIWLDSVTVLIKGDLA